MTYTGIDKPEATDPAKNLDAYDAQPDVIYGDLLDRQDYLALAGALWRQGRHAEAERTLEAAMEKLAGFSAALDLYDRIRADRSTMYQPRQTPLSQLRFYLDSLRGLTARKGQLQGAEVRGWIEVAEPGSDLLVQEGDAPVRVESFTRERPDVIAHLTARGAPDRVLLCGFSFHADLSRPLRISLRSPSAVVPVVEVVMQPIRQVVEGRDGWLFLDNDTNKSVDIFTGRLPASRADGDNWAKFARGVQARLDDMGISNCTVIAPAKEDVFPEFHPLTPAHISLLDVVVSAIFTAGVRVSSPVRSLRKDLSSYYSTDTHWSDLGAWICVQDILSILGLSLPGDFLPKFTDTEVIGDLGSKLDPVRRSIRKVWAPDISGARLVYNNGVIGSGSIQISENPTAPIGKRVVAFGDSFARQLTRVMADIFAEVTWINCPATMPIIEVIERVKPDIVLSQTNARYLKSCPRLCETIADSTLSKLDRSQMPPDWFST